MQSRREGFTLAELLVVAVMGTIILGAVYQTLVSQERSVRQSYAIVGTQQNVRTAMLVLTSDLREISATDSDILAADSVSITYRALRKAGIVCDSDSATGTWVDVLSMGDPFVQDDSIMVYADNGNASSANDDTWINSVVSSVSTSTATLCTGNPITNATIQRLVLAIPSPDTIRPGGLVRSWTRVMYRLDNASATEGNLVRAEGANVGTGTVTALVEDLSPIAGQGLRFRYWDTARVAIPYTSLTTQANRNTIGRIQVKVRGWAVGAGTGRSGTVREFSDSLVSNIYLRGNRKLQ